MLFVFVEEYKICQIYSIGLFVERLTTLMVIHVAQLCRKGIGMHVTSTDVCTFLGTDLNCESVLDAYVNPEKERLSCRPFGS